MSRSFKKTPGFKDCDKFGKKYANRVIRQFKGNIPSGGFFKKLFDKYYICDWSWLFFSTKKINEFYEENPYCVYIK